MCVTRSTITCFYRSCSAELDAHHRANACVIVCKTSTTVRTHVILKGWLFTPESATNKVPCLVMSHGWSALKEMDLDAFANYFTSKLSLSCLVYDQRGFGDSDQKDGHPRQEIIPSLQQSDISDAITFAQSLSEVDPTRIGIWGSSYSGGHVLFAGAVDRRVKAVLSQV